MDVISFIYNLMLLILYSCTISSCFYAYLNTRNKVYCRIIELFVFFLFDLSIIYILEFVYDVPLNIHSTSPMSAFPVLRMALFGVGVITYTRLFNSLIREKWKLFQFFPITFNFIPIAIAAFHASGKNLLVDWLTYSCRYAALIMMLLYFLWQLSRPGHSLDEDEKKLVRKLDLLILCFMLLSLLENTVVLINWEAYATWLSAFAPKLSERIFTEDIYSVVLSLVCIFNCHKMVQKELSRKQEIPPAISSYPIPISTSALPDNRKEAFYDSLKLTKREREIVGLLLQDKSNQEISEALFISLGTAKTHVHNIFQKAGVTKRRQLIERFLEYDSGSRT